MQDRIRDRKDSSKAKEVRESTERAEQHSSEKVEKNLVRKKQQKSRSLQRRSIQSNSSVESEAVPHTTSDTCIVLSNSVTKLKGVQEKEKTVETAQSASSAPVAITEQCELKSTTATTEQDSSDQDDNGSDTDERVEYNTEQQQQFGLAATPVSTSEVQGPFARQLQTMMVLLHNMSGDITSLKAKLVPINSRIEAIELHKIPSEAQNYGIPVSTTKLNPGFGFGRLAVPN